MDPTPGEPVPRPRSILCPYCGEVSPQTKKCVACGGLFEPLSRQATQNAMGPWFIRDPAHPFRPGCSYETILALIRAGRVGPTTVIRGPTTRQFWTLARRAPGIGHLFGTCHSCQTKVEPDFQECPKCGVSFMHEPDRQQLGLGPVRLLPGQAPPETVARVARPISNPTIPRAVVPTSHHLNDQARNASSRLSVLPILLIVGGTVAAGALTFWAIRTVWEPLDAATKTLSIARDSAETHAPIDLDSPADLVLEPSEPTSDPEVTLPGAIEQPSEPPKPQTGTKVAVVSEAIRSALRAGRLEEARRLLADAGEFGDENLARSFETIETIRRLRRLP